MSDAVRIVLELLVLGAIWGWLTDLMRHWLLFTRRARRVSAAILVTLVGNAVAVLVALSSGRPITWGTWVLLGAYLVLNAAMLFRPANDFTTERQYTWLLERRRAR